MIDRSIKVRIIKQTNTTVTLFFVSLNRKMPVPREEFDARVADGTYEVINAPQATQKD